MQMIDFKPRKVRAIFVLVLLIIIHLTLDGLFRPMAYSQNLDDFGLKDSFTQFTAVIGISLLILLFEQDKITTDQMGKIFLTLVQVVAMLFYELI